MKKNILCIIVMLISVNVFANDSITKLLEAAKKGDVESQAFLGGCYYHGEGVPQDYKQAVFWYQKAAEQGMREVQFILGGCYYYGEGVPKNYKQAVFWYQKAAEQGLSIAQYFLGRCYYDGKGVPQDYKQAVFWYQKAAEQGFPSACSLLANCYALGEGVPKNYKLSYMWLSIYLAFENNEADRSLLKKMELQMTPTQIAEAQDMASEWFKKFNAAN